VELGRFDTPGFASGVAITPGTAWIADGWAGVTGIAIDDPLRPKLRARHESEGWALGVAARDGVLYVAAADDGLRILDVSIPSLPAGSAVLATANSFADQVASDGGIAVVADRRRGVIVVDAAEPRDAVEAGGFTPMGFADGAAPAGPRLYVAAGPYGIRVVDVTDVARPREAGSLKIAGGSLATLVTAAGDRLFAQVTPRFVAVDARDPSDMTASYFRFPEIGTIRTQVLHGGLLVIANEATMRLVNVTDPGAPCVLSTVPIGTLTLDGPISIGTAVSGHLAYITVGRHGLWIYDISNPRAPVKVGEFRETDPESDQPVSFGEIVVRDSMAYVYTDAFGRKKIQVLDLADPLEPRVRGTYPLPSGTDLTGPALALADGTLLVGTYWGGLFALDIRNPDAPSLKGHLDVPQIFAVAIDERAIWIAAAHQGLLAIRAVPSSTASDAPVFSARPHRLPSRTWAAPLPAASAAPVRQSRLATSGRTITVATTADEGAGSLRDALEQAAGGDTVRFDPSVFPPASPATIRVRSQLPAISFQENITIDASDAGVVLDGADAPAGTHGLLLFQSHRNTIRGLQITSFRGDGIRLDASQENLIGGDRGRGAAPAGEGNVIGNNGGSGIYLWNSSDRNRITGNLVGLDATGNVPRGNANLGVGLIVSSYNVLGGATAGERNVIASNAYTDVAVGGRRNRIIGNYLGADVTGLKALAVANYFTLAIDGGSPGHVVHGNVIASSNTAAVLLGDTGTNFNQLTGNRINVNAAGAAFGGMGGMIVLEGFNRIGGAGAEERNLIRGGIWAAGGDTIIQGNLVNTDPSGRVAIGIGGIAVSSRRNFVGGTGTGDGNVTTNIQLDAVSVANAVTGNFVGTDREAQVIFGCEQKPCMEILGADGNAVTGNLLSGSDWMGISVTDGADRNLLHSNVMTAHQRAGVEITEGTLNVFHRNSFSGNGRNAIDEPGGNQWDDGARGNYWSDYPGSDADGDGIGDQPYTVQGTTKDRYPLVQAPRAHEIPSLSTLEPSSADAGSPGLTLTVQGARFSHASVVVWNGVPKATTFVDATRLTAVIPQEDLVRAGRSAVSVVTPSPGGGVSEPAPFRILGSSRRRAVRR
jgi:hypothetical protein